MAASNITTGTTGSNGASRSAPGFAPAVTPRCTYGDVAERLQANGWSPLPLSPRTKKPSAPWGGRNKVPLSVESLHKEIKERRGHNIGLAIPNTVLVVDIDVLDPAVARAAVEKSLEILGPAAMYRVGRAPKITAWFGVAAPGTIRSRKLNPLELFSGTGQVAAFGTHPDTGQPYRWKDNVSPLVRRPEELKPCVTAAQVEEFIRATNPILDPLRPAFLRAEFMRADASGRVPGVLDALRGVFQRAEMEARAQGLEQQQAEALAATAAMQLAIHPRDGAGTRHDTMLAVTLELGRAGWSPENIAELVRAIAAGDPEKWDDDDWPEKASGMARGAIAKQTEALGLGPFG